MAFFETIGLSIIVGRKFFFPHFYFPAFSHLSDSILPNLHNHILLRVKSIG